MASPTTSEEKSENAAVPSEDIDNSSGQVSDQETVEGGASNETSPDSADLRSMPQFTGDIGPSSREFDQSAAEQIRLFLQPIIAIGAFVFILFTGILPNITSIFDVFGEIGVLAEEYDDTVVNLRKLQQITNSVDALDADVAALNAVTGVEGRTQVVVFQDKISELALQSGLKIVEQKTGENIIDDDQSAEGTGQSAVGVVEVPSNFVLEGTFSNVQRFISNLNGVTDFLVIGKMDLQLRDNLINVLTATDEAVWKLDIDLVKYIFQEAEAGSELFNLYVNVPIDSLPDEEVMNFIKERGDLAGVNDQSDLVSDSN